MLAQKDLQYSPNMSPSEVAKIWMLRNECTDNGLAAINYNDDKTMSVNYQETKYGIVIITKNGTCIPVPYKYDGCDILLCD